VQKSRVALVEAFNELLLDENRYSDIRVGDILRKSEVGKSTFYEHFRDKDDLLIQSMAGILSILASTLDEQCDLSRLEGILDHFYQNAPLARGFVNSPSFRQVIRELGKMMEKKLPTDLNTTLPVSLIALQIAEAQFGLVGAWLTSGTASSAQSVAQAMHQSALGLKRAYVGS
jgi:AcrR family transcriptional regulator